MPESAGVSEDIHTSEHTQFIYRKPVFGRTIPEKQQDIIYHRRNEAIEHEVIINESLYDEHTQDEFLARKPRIAAVVHLPHTADAFRANYSFPLAPDSLTDASHDGAIMALGLPLEEIFYYDDPTHYRDDTLRKLLVEGSPARIQDGFDRSLKTRFSEMRRERPDKIFAYASSFMSPVLKIMPFASKVAFLSPLFIPVSAARSSFYARDFLHKEFDHITNNIPLLDDPETFAAWQRFFKPYFEKTDTRELEIALAGLKTTEGVARLKDLGIEGNVVPFAERDYASAEYVWDTEEEQIREVTNAVSSLIDIRKQFALLEEKELTAANWKELRQEMINQFSRITLFKVDRKPGANTVSALPHRIPKVASFESKKVTGIIDAVFGDQVGLLAA